MKIIYNYDRKDIFGKSVFTSDETSFVGTREIDKAFNLFKKDAWSAIHVVLTGEETYSFTWEHYNDCENGVVTVTYSPQWNIKEVPQQMTLTKAKKLAKSFLPKEA